MHQKTRRIALLGLLFAVSLVLSFLEGLIPPLPAMPPGVKLGLANIVVMYSLLCLDFRSALTLTALKGLSAFLMRGAISACMSLAGSLVSVLAMEGVVLLSHAFKKSRKVDLLTLAMTGSIGHNLGQIGMSVLLLKTTAAFYYLPVLLVSGVVMGVVTGSTLRVVMPHIQRLQLWGEGSRRQ